MHFDGLYCIITYSMVQSLSWEANWFAASQEIPRISRNPKVHYRTHKRPPTVSILSQPYPVHIPTTHILEICPNIIHPSTPRSPQWSLCLRFPHQDPIRPYIILYNYIKIHGAGNRDCISLMAGSCLTCFLTCTTVPCTARYHWYIFRNQRY